MLKKLFNYIFPIILVFGFIFWAIKPLLQPGFFPMHDDTQVARVIEMGKSLGDGQFPVRWVSDLGYGYGYPIFNFYGPLPYYIGGFLYLIGIDALLATKMMILIGMLIATFTAYLLGNRIFGRLGGILMAVLFTYVPYHAVDIFVRGAIGEFWALAFLPLLLWSVIGVSQKDHKSIYIGGFAMAAVIISHTILGYLTVGIYIGGLIIYGLFSWLKIIKMPDSYPLVKILILGLTLSAFFWIPALFEKQYTSLVNMTWDKTDYRDHFVCPAQLWNSLWGFGGSTAGCLDGMSFKLGKIYILTSFVALVIFIIKRRTINNFFYLPMMIGSILSVTSGFMVLKLSQPIWNIIPNAQYIQYPWRFLSFMTLGLAMMSGFILVIFTNKAVRLLITASILFIVIFYNAKLFIPQFSYLRSSSDFASNTELKWRVSKISDEYLPLQLKRPKNSSGIINSVFPYNPDLSVSPEFVSSNYLKFPVDSKKNLSVTLNQAYFPGWKYWVNNDEVKPKIINGLPQIKIPAGYSVIQIYFTNTPIRTFSNIISMLAIGYILYIYGKKTIS
jgi:uncharacterized membrane protein